jgi:hypothetical protein
MVGRRSDNEHQGRLERPGQLFERPHISLFGSAQQRPYRVEGKSAGFCQIGFREPRVNGNLPKVGNAQGQPKRSRQTDQRLRAATMVVPLACVDGGNAHARSTRQIFWFHSCPKSRFAKLTAQRNRLVNSLKHVQTRRDWQCEGDFLVSSPNGSQLSEEHAGLLNKAGIGVRQDVIARLERKDGCLQAILFANGETLARKALFFTTGQHPRSPLLEKLGCRFDEEGGVACDPDGRTSVPGVFVAGDVSRDVQLAIIAASEGARAALAINKRLLDNA